MKWDEKEKITIQNIGTKDKDNKKTFFRQESMKSKMMLPDYAPKEKIQLVPTYRPSGKYYIQGDEGEYKRISVPGYIGRTPPKTKLFEPIVEPVVAPKPIVVAKPPPEPVVVKAPTPPPATPPTPEPIVAPLPEPTPPPPPPEPEPKLEYKQNDTVFTTKSLLLNETITKFIPKISIEGEGTEEISLEDYNKYDFTLETAALPTGLELNKISGNIEGTPTVKTPSTIYTITATTRDTQKKKITCEISLSVNDPPLPELTYKNERGENITGNPNIFTKVEIEPFKPNLSTGNIEDYTYSGTLPKGLVVDPVTGIITGKPTEAKDSSEHYIITAEHKSKDTAQKLIYPFLLQIKEGTDTPPPPAPKITVTYPPISIDFNEKPMQQVKSEPTIDPAGIELKYELVGKILPYGLTLDPSTGVVLGTPKIKLGVERPKESETYKIKVTSVVGTSVAGTGTSAAGTSVAGTGTSVAGTSAAGTSAADIVETSITINTIFQEDKGKDYKSIEYPNLKNFLTNLYTNTSNYEDKESFNLENDKMLVTTDELERNKINWNTDKKSLKDFLLKKKDNIVGFDALKNPVTKIIDKAIPGTITEAKITAEKFVEQYNESIKKGIINYIEGLITKDVIPYGAEGEKPEDFWNIFKKRAATAVIKPVATKVSKDGPSRPKVTTLGARRGGGKNTRKKRIIKSKKKGRKVNKKKKVTRKMYKKKKVTRKL